jgi:hypothetical protein
MMAAQIGYRPPVEIVDLPEGAFAAAKAADDAMFANPSRFFSPVAKA